MMWILLPSCHSLMLVRKLYYYTEDSVSKFRSGKLKASKQSLLSQIDVLVLNKLIQYKTTNKTKKKSIRPNKILVSNLGECCCVAVNVDMER